MTGSAVMTSDGPSTLLQLLISALVKFSPVFDINQVLQSSWRPQWQGGEGAVSIPFVDH